jgi:hypothetical protein
VSRPQVSILMAVRNEQDHLPAALASLQAQSLRDWELVAVDDGSRDRPRRLARTAQNCSAEAFCLCKLHHLQRCFLKDAGEVTLWGAGMEGKMWRRILAQAGVKVARWVEVDRRKIGQKIHGAPVVPIDTLKAGEGPVLVTVGARGARSQIRTWSREKGLKEGRDLICVT